MQRQYMALSGLAMALVVLNHAIHMGLLGLSRLGYPALPDGWRFTLTAVQALGAFAVPIFFVVSGSFMAYAARSAPRLSASFVWKSVRHIVWPYVVWSLLYYVLMAVHQGERYSALGYLKNLAVGYPFHFVPLLIAFYLLSPLLIPLARRFSWLLLAAFGLYQLFLLALREPGLFGFAFPAQMDVLFPLVLGNPLADWAIYFPMGLVFGLHAARWKPRLLSYRWALVAATILLFGAGLLDVAGWLEVPWARYLCPVPLMFILPTIERKAIPAVGQLETVGKRSYGLYLTHLIVMNLVLIALELIGGQTVVMVVLIFPLLLVAGLLVPMLLMGSFQQRGATRKVYRYVFG